MNEKLVFQSGLHAGKEFPLSNEEITIGRDPENTIVLDDVQISRVHLKIYRNNHEWFIEDLKSTNGTVLNGKALKKAQKLKNGDLVTLGENNVFEVLLPADSPEAIPAEEISKPEAHKKTKVKKTNPAPTPANIDSLTDTPEGLDEKHPRKLTERYPKWAIILMIAIAFIIVFCVIPLVIIEVTDQWCNLFSGFFNSVSPGVCP